MVTQHFNTTELTQELHRLTGLSFNARLCNALAYECIHTVEEFQALDLNQFKIPNIGVKSIRLIREVQKALLPPLKAPAGLTPLEWELWWIDQHLDRYESVAHAVAVKRNIEKRYELAAQARYITQLEQALQAHKDAWKKFITSIKGK